MRMQLKLMVLNEISKNQQRYWDSSTREDEDVHNILLRSKWQIISAFPSLKAFRSELASKSFCLSPAGCWLIELVVCHRLWIKIREQQKEKKMQIWMKCWLWKLQTADGSHDMRLQARWYAGLQKSSTLTERWRFCVCWGLKCLPGNLRTKKNSTLNTLRGNNEIRAEIFWPSFIVYMEICNSDCCNPGNHRWYVEERGNTQPTAYINWMTATHTHTRSLFISLHSKGSFP